MKSLFHFKIFLCCVIPISSLIGQNNSVPNNEPTLLVLEGDSLSTIGKYNQANQLYLTAIKKFKEWNYVQDAGQVSIKIANNYYATRNPKPALAILQDYLDYTSKQIGKKDTLTAMVYHKIGVGNYWDKEFERAIVNYRKALNIRTNLLHSSSPDIIKGYHNIGGCFAELNLPDSALVYLYKSLDIQGAETTKLTSNTYRELGRTYKLLGNLKKAEYFFENNLKLSGLLQKEDWQIAGEELELSNLYIEAKLPDKTIIHAKKAINICDKMKSKYKEDIEVMANSYFNLGGAFLLKKEYIKAVNNYNKSLLVGKEVWPKDALGDVYSNLGIIYKRQKEFSKSLNSFSKALMIYKNANINSKIANAYNNLGDLFQEQNYLKNALHHYQHSLIYAISFFQPENDYENPKPISEFSPNRPRILTYTFAKAKTFKDLYDQNHHKKDLQAAHETYQLLDELIDNIRLSYLEDASKSYLAKQTKPIYEQAIGVCLKYYEYSKDKKYLEQAFQYAEKSKAIILLEQIKEAKAKTFAGIPDSLQLQERTLKKEIGQIEKELALKTSKVKIDSLEGNLREKLIHKKQTYEALVKTLEADNPKYHQLKYDIATTDIATIQSIIIKDNQVLVEYFVGEDSLYLFKVTKDDFKVISKPIDFPLKEWVDSLRQGIYYCRLDIDATQQDCDQLDRQYTEYGAKLYQKLIVPLNLSNATSDVIFIPDGVLGYIPFDALLAKPIPDSQQAQFHQYPYFGLEKTINYSFSATFLNELGQTSISNGKNQLLAFAPSFNLGQGEEIVSENHIAAIRNSLSPLLFNQTEIEQIGEEVSITPFSNLTANKKAFVEEAPNYKYIHIASHGKMNDENADLSYIAFTQNADSTDQEELLYLRELYDLDIPAKMVVLSACETGIGELQNGEGIISLARGFSYAGAKSIITSLWSVNDQKTADLMLDFYKNLKGGQDKAHALANAKRDYITSNTATFAHPFYWAGFIPIGDMGSIELSSDWNCGILSLIGLSLLFGLFIGKRLKSTVT